MSSPMSNKFKARMRDRTFMIQEDQFSDMTCKQLKEKVQEDLKAERTKTKGFQDFQDKMASLFKQSADKEKEFQKSSDIINQKLTKKNEKTEFIDLQIQKYFKDSKEQNHQLQVMDDKAKLIKMEYEEQLEFKKETFQKTLQNKDEMIAYLRECLAKQKEEHLKIKGYRVTIESDLREREEQNIKLKDEVDNVKNKFNQNKPNPKKQAQIESLKKQLQEYNDALKEKLEDRENKSKESEAFKDKIGDLKKTKMDLEGQRYKLVDDQEDQEYLERRIAEVKKSVNDMVTQENKISKKVNKRRADKTGALSSNDDLNRIIELIYTLNNYERESQGISDELRKIENKILTLIEDQEIMESQQMALRYKLIYTLGTQKASQGGGAGFFIKQALIKIKSNEVKDIITQLRQEKDLCKEMIKKINQSLHDHSLNLDQMIGSISQYEQELNQSKVQLTETGQLMQGLRSKVDKTETDFSSIKEDFERSQDRLRLAYINEVKAFLRELDQEFIEISEKFQITLETLKKFEKDSDKTQKSFRQKDKKQEFTRLIKTGQIIKDDCNSGKTTLLLRESQFKAVKDGCKDFVKMNLQKIFDLLGQLKDLENLVIDSKNDAKDVESRSKDMYVLFRDVVKQVSKEIYNEMITKVAQKQNQIQNTQKKDQHLLTLLHNRRVELGEVQIQLEESDADLYKIYRNYEKIYEEATGEEEKAALVARQLNSQIDRLNKQQSRIVKENFQIEDSYIIIQELDNMEQLFQGCDKKLDEGIKKANRIEPKIKDLEAKIKNDRMIECESVHKITISNLDHFKRTLNRLKARLNMIEKDQGYLADEYTDMEKKKESLAFKQEIDKRIKELNTYMVVKDKIQHQIDQIEKVYEEKLSNFDPCSGQEFQRISKENEKNIEEIKRQLKEAEGPFAEEIQACKEIVDKMVSKYRRKKEKYGEAQLIKMTKESQILTLSDKLVILKDKIHFQENQLATLGIKENDDGSEQFRKFDQNVKNGKQLCQDYKRNIDKMMEKINEDTMPLDQVENKVVKTMKIDDIIVVLSKLQVEPIEINIQKFEQLVRQTEKEIETFTNKIRSKLLAESEIKFKQVEDQLRVLAKLQKQVMDEAKLLNNEVEETSKTKKIPNKADLILKIQSFYDSIETSQDLKDKLLEKVNNLKQQLKQIDRKSVSMNEINSFLKEGHQISNLSMNEIDKMNDIQEEISKLRQQFMDQNKFEEERIVKVNKIKASLQENKKLIEKISKQLEQNNLKADEFDELYNSMLLSQDYEPHTIIEKKMRRISQYRTECMTYETQKNTMEERNNKLLSQNLDTITDLQEINTILKESGSINTKLNENLKNSKEVHTQFEKKRKKIADAQIRAVSQTRKDELEKANQLLTDEFKVIQTIEESLDKRQNDPNNPDKISSEKEQEVRETIAELRISFQEKKQEYDALASEVRNLTTEVDTRDLENREPMSKLAEIIEKLNQLNQYISDLVKGIEIVKMEIQQRSTVVTTIDTEMRIKTIREQLKKYNDQFDDMRHKIIQLVNISNDYDGYTSDQNDDQFHKIIIMEGKEDLTDLSQTQKTFQETVYETEKVYDDLRKKKQKFGGNLRAEDVEDFQPIIEKLEAKFQKSEAKMEQLQSHHGLEIKIERRGEELNEIENLIKEIFFDAADVRARIEKECEELAETSFYNSYCKRLSEILPHLDSIIEDAKTMSEERDKVMLIQQEVNSKIPLATNERIPLYQENLELKKMIAELLKNTSHLHTLVKESFKEANTIFTKKPQPKEKPTYKAHVGDEVDQLFQYWFNKLGINVPTHRLGGGFYMFGTKKIFCKIMNGKLVVRIGGGFMGIEDFVNQYGASELEKSNLQVIDPRHLSSKPGSGTNSMRTSAVPKKNLSGKVSAARASPHTTMNRGSPRNINIDTSTNNTKQTENSFSGAFEDSKQSSGVSQRKEIPKRPPSSKMIKK